MSGPAFSIALALLAGVLAQALARRLNIPGIVLLLATGVVLGPDVVGLVHPASLGHSLSEIVGLSVAVILFEGGLNLNLKRLRREAALIQRLILLGSVVTAVGATFAVKLALGWPWPIAILFGTLVIVTGPTVITPLLRRIRVKPNVSTILEAEGVLIDPIGAIIAVVALEVVVAETAGGAARGVLNLPLRLLLGAGMGVVGGVLIARLLRSDRLIPEGLENVLTLSFVLSLFEISNALIHESGILAVTVAGLIAGNVNSRLSRELRDFKEQLTVMLIGMIFVILAADVRISGILSLGGSGLLAVVLLMFVVRPLNVVASTWGSTLTLNERAFIAWLSPRGIVAAAVASVFARRLSEAGLPFGPELRNLVFLVIAVTVVVQGLSGNWIASVLGVRRPSHRGYIVAGANQIARALARALQREGETAVLVDSNAGEVALARSEGFETLHGSAADENLLEQADIEGKKGFIAATPNDGLNLVLAGRARRVFHVHQVYAALLKDVPGVSRDQAADSGIHLLSGDEFEWEQWNHDLLNGEAGVQVWSFSGSPESVSDSTTHVQSVHGIRVLPISVKRGGSVSLVDESTTLREGDRMTLLVQSAEDLPAPGDRLGRFTVLETLNATEGAPETHA